MWIYDTNTNEPASAGIAFASILAHAVSSGWGEMEAAEMCRQLDDLLSRGGDDERAIELFDELDGARIGLELRP